MKSFNPQGIDAACKEAGLSAGTVKLHAKRIFQDVTSSAPGGFTVIDACRINNAGIVPCLDTNFKSANRPLEYVALVPAAGAASRFLEPFTGLVAALKSGDRQAILDQALAFRDISAAWPLPRLVRDFISEVCNARDAGSEGSWSRIIELLERPKALFPFSLRFQSDFTFLAAKLSEHAALAAQGEKIAGEVYVSAPGFKPAFEETISNGARRLPTLVLEQGGRLSTLRFGANGQVLRDAEGRPAVVPAGHGALLELFSAIRERFPGCDYLLIRNVDNVCGIDSQVIGAISAFTTTAAALIGAVRDIRAWLSRETNLPPAGATLPESLVAPVRVLSHFTYRNDMSAATNVDFAATLLRVQRDLFHSPGAVETGPVEDRKKLHELLRHLYDRPVNVLGQVPNSGKDVGGTPAFVRRPDGVQEKLCIEVGHVPAEEVESILKNPRRATHFNPVFVAAELPGGTTPPVSADHPYWSVVRKRFAGQDAYYHESFLYEILGSSSLANVVFVEIPRLLFNPHKTLADKAEHPVVF